SEARGESQPECQDLCPRRGRLFQWTHAVRVYSAHSRPAAEHELLPRRATRRLSLWLAMAGREFRDCPEDHGNFSRLLRIDYSVREAWDTRHERAVTGDQDARGTGRRGGMLASGRRQSA